MILADANFPSLSESALFFHARDVAVHERLAQALREQGARLERFGDGLKMHCAAGAEWKQVIANAAAALSTTERRATRVASLPPGQQPAPLGDALLTLRRLDQFLDRIASEWLADVLAGGGLKVEFQPIVQQPPGRIHGHECFSRGVGENGAPISPTKMLAAAEHLEILPQLDEQCRLLAIRRSSEQGLGAGQLFINLHPGGIYHPPTCFAKTIDAIASAGLSPGQITFEASPFSEHSHVIDIVRFLQSRGFKTALDRVGRGSTSLLAGDMRVDYLKLDADLFRSAARSAADARQVGDLAEAARQRGMLLIACGIESREELKFAFNVGIRFTQGFVHAKPAAALVEGAAAKELIATSRATYAARRNAHSPATSKPWDIAGLYQKLTTLTEREAPRSQKTASK